MWWLVATALAGAPDGVLANEADTWEEAWPQIQSGPEGCYEVVGRVTWSMNRGRAGGETGNTAFVGKFQDGVWSDLLVKSLGVDVWDRGSPPQRIYPHGMRNFVPLFGTLAPNFAVEDDGLTSDVVRTIVDSARQDDSTSWSEWDDADRSVMLHRVLPVDGRSADLKIDVTFPEGEAYPAQVHYETSGAFSVPGRRGVKVRSAEGDLLAVELGGEVFPSVESFTFEASTLGSRIEGSQTIRYLTFRACGAHIDDEITSLQL